MWSIFSRDPTKDFAFEIGESVSGLESQSIWNLHNGKRKTNGELVSIFVFNVASSNESGKETALASVKRLKSLRHPNVLTFIDSLETDKFVYMVTELVVPLSQHIKEELSNTEVLQKIAISWGIHQVVKGLSFINNVVNLIHNNVCMSSMFVDKAGEWKLGGIDYMYPASGEGSNISPYKTLPELEKYDPPEKTMKNRARKATKWSQDMWGVGCLIWEVFNGILPRPSSLKVLGKIPKNLVNQYCELVSANPTTRPPPDRFLESCLLQGNFMDNHFVKTNLFMEEIQIKDAKELSEFFSDITSHLDNFPTKYSRYKILPQLLNAFQFGNAGSSVLAPLFKLGKLLGPEEYQLKIVPCVVKLFSSTDRATRINLLRQLPMFVEHLQPQVVNAQLFPNIVSGFMDSNPAIREQSIKAIVLLAPKLNDNNLNNELMKHFARLQARDDQGPIRTNTTVCLGKIVSLLSPVTRQKVVSSAFMRAMRDPFPAARSAGVLAMSNTIQYYTIVDCAMKAIPSLSPLLMDKEQQVRENTFKTIQLFIDKLKTASESPEKAAEMDSHAAVAASLNQQPVSGWGGWMSTGVSSLTSRLYKGKNPSDASTASAGDKVQLPTGASTNVADQTNKVPIKSVEEVERPNSETEQRKQTGSDGDLSDYGDDSADGWKDDGWGDAESTLPPKSRENVHIVTTSQLKAMEANYWEELTKEKNNVELDPDPVDESADLDFDSTGWGNDWEDDFDEKKTKKQTSTYSTTKPVATKKVSGGWDEWEEDASDFFNNTSTTVTKKPNKSAIPDPWDTKDPNKPASSYGWDSNEKKNEDDFFNDLIINNKKTTKKNPASESRKKVEPIVTKKKNMANPVKPEPVLQNTIANEDDWDAWGGEDDGFGTDDKSLSKAELLKQQREQKRKERQEKLAARKAIKPKGGMKLGARKVD